MIDNPFRVRLERLLKPFLHLLDQVKISPNHITLVSFLIALLAVYFVATGQLISAFFLVDQ